MCVAVICLSYDTYMPYLGVLVKLFGSRPQFCNYTVKSDDVRCSQQFEMSRLSFLFLVPLASIKRVQTSQKYLLVMYLD